MDCSVAQEEIFSTARGILALSHFEQGWALESGIIEFRGRKYKVFKGKDHTLMIIIKINSNS